MKAQLIAFIEHELLNDLHAVDADQDLLLSGLLDSIAVMRLVAFIEAQLECQVPPEDVTLENFSSVDAIAGYLETMNVGT